MSDYIKREDAKDAVINIVGWKKIAMYVDEMLKHFSTKGNDYYDALIDAEDVIDDLPSADVAPVRHGHWIDEGEYADYTNVHAWRCSECEDHVLNYKCDLSRYCPNCGARMDGESDD